jgi:hypothetical protein
MPSNEATAAAPIATGVLLAGTATRELTRHGPEIWTALALAGGLSAVAVGLGAATGLGGFGPDSDFESDFDSDSGLDVDSGGARDRTRVALVGLAATCVAVGAGIALV